MATPSGMPGRTGFGFGAKRLLSRGFRRPACGLRGSHFRSGMMGDPTRAAVWLAALALGKARHHACRLIGRIGFSETFNPGPNCLGKRHILPVADELLLQPHGPRTGREQRIETPLDRGVEFAWA